MSAAGMAVQALAGEIVAAVKADAGYAADYDIAAGRFGPAMTDLLRRLAADALTIARPQPTVSDDDIFFKVSNILPLCAPHRGYKISPRRLQRGVQGRAKGI